MSLSEFWVFYLCVLVAMLAYRIVPLFALKGRELSPGVERALGYIPVAAFAALVANDLFDPASGVAGLEPVSLVSAILVVAVAKKTGSLIWCALAGMAAYALLGLVL